MLFWVSLDLLLGRFGLFWDFVPFCIVLVCLCRFGSFWAVLVSFGLFWLILGRFRSVRTQFWVVLAYFESFFFGLGQ